MEEGTAVQTADQTADQAGWLRVRVHHRKLLTKLAGAILRGAGAGGGAPPRWGGAAGAIRRHAQRSMDVGMHI